MIDIFVVIRGLVNKSERIYMKKRNKILEDSEKAMKKGDEIYNPSNMLNLIDRDDGKKKQTMEETSSMAFI